MLVNYLALQEKNKYTESFYRLNIFFPVIQPICILTLTTVRSLQIRILAPQISVVDPDPHLDPDPHHFGNLDPHPDPHQIKIRIRSTSGSTSKC